MLLQAADVDFGYGPQERAARRQPPAGRVRVLHGVSLAVSRGSIVGLLGPNGSGKTTLLKLLSGALRPAAGSIEIDGRPLASLPRRALARRLAVVPQETHTAFDYTVLEMVLMGRYSWLGPFEVEGAGDRAAALDALATTGTSHLADRLFPTLSGGEKQRVVIASALAQLDDRTAAGDEAAGRGPLLFLDEPTASLDLHYQLEVALLISELRRRRDVTIVLSTHDLRLASGVCDHVVLLREGRVLAGGPAAATLTPARVAELYAVDERLVAPLLH